MGYVPHGRSMSWLPPLDGAVFTATQFSAQQAILDMFQFADQTAITGGAGPVYSRPSV